MKKVIIEIDDAYGEVLAIAASGRRGPTLNVHTLVIDLNKINKVEIDNKGKDLLSYEESDKDIERWLLSKGVYMDCRKCIDSKKGCYKNCKFYQAYKKGKRNDIKTNT